MWPLLGRILAVESNFGNTSKRPTVANFGEREEFKDRRSLDDHQWFGSPNEIVMRLEVDWIFNEIYMSEAWEEISAGKSQNKNKKYDDISRFFLAQPVEERSMNANDAFKVYANFTACNVCSVHLMDATATTMVQPHRHNWCQQGMYQFRLV